MLYASLRTFSWLMYRDLIIIRRSLRSKIIDATIWTVTALTISTYILPLFGITKTYGAFIWAGSIVTMSFFEAFSSIDVLLRDFEGTKTIKYVLTLPLPAWLIVIRMMCYIAIDGMVLSACTIPIGKIVLLDHLSFDQFSIPKFAPIFITLNLWCGCFAVWVASWVHGNLRAASIRRRLQTPLWNLGGYAFNWFALNKALPPLSYITLANPLTYAFEGVRSATLGPAEYLNFWICLLVLWCFIIVQFILTFFWLRRRLDFV